MVDVLMRWGLVKRWSCVCEHTPMTIDRTSTEPRQNRLLTKSAETGYIKSLGVLSMSISMRKERYRLTLNRNVVDAAQKSGKSISDAAEKGLRLLIRDHGDRSYPKLVGPKERKHLTLDSSLVADAKQWGESISNAVEKGLMLLIKDGVTSQKRLDRFNRKLEDHSGTIQWLSAVVKSLRSRIDDLEKAVQRLEPGEE